MLVNHAEQILRAGGSLKMDTFLFDHMLTLAIAAKAGGGHVTFVGPVVIDLMVRVVAAAPGHVTFDVATYPVRQ